MRGQQEDNFGGHDLREEFSVLFCSVFCQQRVFSSARSLTSHPESSTTRKQPTKQSAPYPLQIRAHTTSSSYAVALGYRPTFSPCVVRHDHLNTCTNSTSPSQLPCMWVWEALPPAAAPLMGLSTATAENTSSVHQRYGVFSYSPQYVYSSIPLLPMAATLLPPPLSICNESSSTQK